MCTVTFIARENGYGLGMNRDEQLSRATGLPPKRTQVNGRVVLGPSEPCGGTWIALNDAGVTFALINWYSVPARVGRHATSRGGIVTAVRGLAARESVAAALDELPLASTNPFRLVGIFPATHEVAEWCWDLQKLTETPHPWKARQWISSGFDEPGAERERSATFRREWSPSFAGSLDWLRRLHRSHSPTRGAFSTCMHRKDAATVSYTEISVSTRGAALHYHAGAPCQSSRCSIHHLQLAREKGIGT